ncbi:MAG: DNA-binding protein [Alphaproteobacteria bacterium BRH_c36]|nr:MAG: DNA-binding protein [Alphaproteobacteria bacterium BRH_c36]
MPEQNLSTDRAAAIAKIRTAMIEKKMTQAELADTACCHEKTVQNMIAGRQVRDQTLFDVCAVLGLDFETIKQGWSGAAVSGPMELRGDGGHAAPVYMGAYTKAAVDHYIGCYLTVRPSFSKADTYVAYRTDIVWDPDWPSLLFEESERPDVTYQHRGRIYVPASSMFVHLVSLTKGAMRMVMVSQLDQSAHMRGLITTLNKQGAMLIPVATPIVFAKRDDIAANEVGEIAPAHRAHAACKALIEETTRDGYAKLIG